MLSLEMCLKLKEAGWEQDKSMLVWQRRGDKWHDINLRTHVYTTKGEILAASPTLEELLGAVVKALPGGYTLEWNLVEYRVCGIHRTLECYAPTPSEAVAALCLKLKAGSE